MRRHHRLAVATAATLLTTIGAAACGTDAPTPSEPVPLPSTALRIVNATDGAVDVVVDGAVVLRGVPATSISASVGVAAGTRAVELRRAGATSGAALPVVAASGRTRTVAAIPGAVLAAAILSDTGAAPVAGRGKLRVVHLAASAPLIDVWRTQPDFPTPIRVMFPFAYRAESSYLQSTPGTWTVFVTPADQASPRLAESGALAVGDGAVRTIVILDAPGGGLQIRPID